MPNAQYGTLVAERFREPYYGQFSQFRAVIGDVYGHDVCHENVSRPIRRCSGLVKLYLSAHGKLSSLMNCSALNGRTPLQRRLGHWRVEFISVLTTV